MAVSSTTITSTGAATLIVNTDVDETDDVAVAASGKLQMVEINNTANTTPLYLQLFNATAGITPGTTEPDMVLFCPAGQKINYIIPAELTFGTGIKMFGSTNLAVSGYSAAGPASAVTVTLLLGT